MGVEIIYISVHCHHQNDFCIKMGSDESHFNVSVGSDGQSHKTVSTNHNLSEEKGEPKRYLTEVIALTRLTPYSRMYLWLSLCTLYLHARQVRVILATHVFVVLVLRISTTN